MGEGRGDKLVWRGYSLSSLLHTALLLILVSGLPTLPGILDRPATVSDDSGDPGLSEDVPVDREAAVIAALLSSEKSATDPDRQTEPPGPTVISFDVVVIREGETLPPAEPATSTSEATPAPTPDAPDATAPPAEEPPVEKPPASPSSATAASEATPAPTPDAPDATVPPAEEPAADAPQARSATPEAAGVTADRTAMPPVESLAVADERIAAGASSAAVPRANAPATRLDTVLAEVAKLDVRLAEAVTPPSETPKTTAELAREKRIFERVRRAADRGYPHAQYNLARMLLQGRGQTRDPEEAWNRLERSAERGYVPAQLLLGYMAARGIGGKPDLGGAEFWWSVAERRGDETARRAREMIDPLMSANDVLAARRLRTQWRQVTSILATEVNDPRDLQALNNQLHEGALQGDSAAVLDALMRGADADSRDDGGRSAMINAAWRGRTEILDLMLANGADIESADDDRRTALMWGAINGHGTIVQRLLDAGGNPDRVDRDGATPLMRAAWNGHPEVVEELLRAGADVQRLDLQGMSALAYAEREGHTEIARRLRAVK